MAHTLKVTRVRSRKDLNRFIKLPWRIYRDSDGYCENWVPPLLTEERAQLDSKKNAFFRHAKAHHFLAWRGPQPVGRVSAIVDRHYTSHYQTQTGFFGFFETFDDQEVADLLLNTAESSLQQEGMEHVIGPVNLSVNHVLGMLVSPFDRPPAIQMAYNPPYYPRLLENAGFRKWKDLFSYEMETTLRLSEKIERVSNIARKRNRVTIWEYDLKRDWDRLIDSVREIYNDAWSNNWGFVPWTREEFHQLGKQLKPFLDPNIAIVACIDGEPVGFILGLPDMNQALIELNGRLLPIGIFKLLRAKRRIHHIRVPAMGVRTAHHNKGIDGILIQEIYRRGEPAGYTSGEFSWILEDNYNLRNLLEAWGTRLTKTYRIYGRSLSR